jgi:hypothetical protein
MVLEVVLVLDCAEEALGAQGEGLRGGAIEVLEGDDVGGAGLGFRI